MRFSQGYLNGRMGELFHPERFKNNEEVIVFRREDFARIYNSIVEHTEYIQHLALRVETEKDWELLGIWPRIMERVNIIDLNMDSLSIQRPVQTHLDAYLFGTSENKIDETISMTLTANHRISSWSR